jgi:serine-type D-Ala-D-Ala carboxypeptidase/endopeptidase (penicillin-binding protein 4)
MNWKQTMLAAVMVPAPLLAPAAGALAQLDQIHNNRVEMLVGKNKLIDAKVGVHIIDAQTGETLAAREERTPLIPASNQKLLTTGAACLTLGHDFVFRTELIADGERLIVRGSGDPALADPVLLDQLEPKMTVDEFLENLARAVKQAGLARVTEIVLDDRVFDRVYVHPAWKPENFDRGYSAQVAGINFHANVLSVFPSPSKDGPPARPVLALEPFAPWIELANEARTVDRGRNLIRLSRTMGTNRIRLMGEIRGSIHEPESITLHEPQLFFGQSLAYKLLEQGISVAGASPGASGERPTREQYSKAFSGVRLVNADEPEASARGRVIAAVTTPFVEILRRCNSDSQNLYAEALLKRLSHEVTREPGTWAGGASIVRMLMSQELGPELTRTTTIADGSGLARDDLVAPATLTRWLQKLRENPRAGEAFVESLSTAGEGSLKRRFSKDDLRCRLRAKSGTIDGVRCLSGYMTDPGTGQCVIFSVMVNTSKPGEESHAVEFYKDIVEMIDEALVPVDAKASVRR